MGEKLGEKPGDSVDDDDDNEELFPLLPLNAMQIHDEIYMPIVKDVENSRIKWSTSKDASAIVVIVFFVYQGRATLTRM